jgi:hypothetical protein
MGKRRLLQRGITVLVLAWFALSVVTVAMVSFLTGWGTMPLEKLPTVFWIMYVTVAVGWFILAVADIFIPTVVSKYGRTPMLDILLLVTGVIAVGGSLFGQAWTGGRLFQLTVGSLLLIQSANHLIQAQIAKRRQTT